MRAHTHTHRDIGAGVPSYSYDIRFHRTGLTLILHIFIVSFFAQWTSKISFSQIVTESCWFSFLQRCSLESIPSWNLSIHLWHVSHGCPKPGWSPPAPHNQPPSLPLSVLCFPRTHFYSTYSCRWPQFTSTKCCNVTTEGRGRSYARTYTHTQTHIRFCPAVHPAESRWFSQFSYSSWRFVIPNKFQLSIRIFYS